MKTINITPCLWFDGQAEQAAKYYISIFKKKSKIKNILRWGQVNDEHAGKPGDVLMVEFEIFGQTFAALNGGPQYKFNEAISFQVPCKTEKELDYYWAKLTVGGDKAVQQCGWLKDKYGVSWQVFPAKMPQMLGSKNSKKADRVMTAMIGMKKIDFLSKKAIKSPERGSQFFPVKRLSHYRLYLEMVKQV